MKFLLLLFLLPLIVFAQKNTHQDIAKYNAEAQRVTIIRDNWGVPHIWGKTDADCVFGLLYAQCEESFEKVEENNLEIMGRLSEVWGEERLYNDLKMRLIYDSAAAINDYNNSPLWLKKLMDASADGVNFYLYKHPETKPKVLYHFEPWFAMLRTNGSISATQDGGITTADMKALYLPKDSSVAYNPISSFSNDPMGSNGFAVAPFKTASHNAILYINPHVTFYYRTEVEMSSDEGLHVYGAVTWGTFFVFQGFNEHCGWMHTSGNVDVADLFTEITVKQNDSLFTKYDNQLLPVQSQNISIKYKTNDGFAQQTFTVYRSVHGPVLGSRNGQWLSLRENNRSLTALEQSWLRTKTKGFNEFKEVMNLRANTSDNTVFADDKGNIAYWHGNFVPRRNTKYDYSLPVDGSTSATDWHTIYALDSIVHVYNPATGFIQNCNSTPFTVSGASSPKQENYPVFMAPDGENFRGLNAVRLLSKTKLLTMEDMIHNIGYNLHLTLFDTLLPYLVKDYHALPTTDSLYSSLHDAIAVLESWDHTASDTSVATALAIEWGYCVVRKMPPLQSLYKAGHTVELLQEAIATTTPKERLDLLLQTLTDLTQRFDNWRIAWGEINRYQRPPNGVFDDKQPSIPVAFTSSLFGSIPASAAQRTATTNRRYGTYGNSFVACVEFGNGVKAKSVVTGGQSFNPQSKHYTDQAQMFVDGNFKDVLFYKEDVLKHVERKYHPGE